MNMGTRALQGIDMPYGKARQKRPKSRNTLEDFFGRLGRQGVGAAHRRALHQELSRSVCRNLHRAAFSLPPILHKASRELARGKIKGTGENRPSTRNMCGQGSRLKFSVSIVKTFSCLRQPIRGPKREDFSNSECSGHLVPLSPTPSACRADG